MSNNKAMRQGYQPFRSAVRPAGGGAQVFIEEWQRGIGRAGGTFAVLNGLYGLPEAWTHVQPTGDNGSTGFPALDASMQMLQLSRSAQADDDTVTNRWNAVCARLPSIAAAGNAWQIDASYVWALDLSSMIAPETPKPGAIGIVIGEDTMLTDWSDLYYFSNTVCEGGLVETSPQIWSNPQTVSDQSTGEGETFMRVYVTLLVSRAGGDTSFSTYVSADGISKQWIGNQIIPNLDPSVIGFAVRTEEPAPGEDGLPAGGWCDYIRVRPAAAGGLGTVVFGQTGGRNW
jgi:hypothetical protein